MPALHGLHKLQQISILYTPLQKTGNVGLVQPEVAFNRNIQVLHKLLQNPVIVKVTSNLTTGPTTICRLGSERYGQ